MVTESLVSNGTRLEINAKTVEEGSLKVEIQDVAGNPFDGFSAAECERFAGDSAAHVVAWNGQTDLSQFADKPVRLRFTLENADLYALKFSGSAEVPPHTFQKR